MLFYIVIIKKLFRELKVKEKQNLQRNVQWFGDLQFWHWNELYHRDYRIDKIEDLSYDIV